MMVLESIKDSLGHPLLQIFIGSPFTSEKSFSRVLRL